MAGPIEFRSGGSTSSSSTIFENPDPLLIASQKLIEPGKVSAIILEGDSMLFGNQASGIATSHQYLFRKKLCDKLNAHLGGSAKSGAGRFGPFFPTSTLSDVDGPVIIPSGSGWTKWSAGGTVPPNNPYWLEMVHVTLRHPGSITPALANHYAGCYMLFNPTAPHPGVAKWLGLLFNGSLTGTFRVIGWQGSSTSAAVAGTTGANRYKFTSGAFGGSDVPNPDDPTMVGAGERKFDVTINPANYPDYIGCITGHLNAAAMDPTSVWALCIYRVDNAATVVEINGFDAHYDEYTAQNTARSDGATSVMSFAWPGDTVQGELDGTAPYGSNADYWQQGVVLYHIGIHGTSYLHPKYKHTMPVAKLAIFNEWRNTLNSVDDLPANVTPAQFAGYVTKKALLYGQAGIASLFLADFGACASSTCYDGFFGTENTTYSAEDYHSEVTNCIAKLKSYEGLSYLAGGLTKMNIDLAFGTGGPVSYAKQSMFSTLDGIHWNDFGQQLISSLLVNAVSGNASILKAKPKSRLTRNRDSRSLTTRAGVTSCSTVLSIDPDDYGALRLGGIGLLPTTDNQSFVTPGFYNGVDLGAMTNTIRGSDAPKLLAKGFGERAGVFFDNATNKNNRVVVTLPSMSLTKFTWVFAIQNLWEGGITSFTGSQGYWMHWGNATDDSKNYTGAYSAWSAGSVSLCSILGVFGGTPAALFGNTTSNTWVTVGDHPNPGALPARDPYIGIVSVDCTARTITTYINPSQTPKTGTLPSGFPSSFSPTALSIGGPLGTGAACIPMLFGGTWLLNGTVTSTEAMQIWSEIQGASANRFEMGTSYTDFGSMKTPT